MKKSQSILKSPRVKENFSKIKLQMNEHEASFHANNDSRLKIVQPEFTTWKYWSAEAANGNVL